MKLRGGHSIRMAGSAGRWVDTAPEPQELRMPLRSSRLAFTDVSVDDGQRVVAGAVLARDPARHGAALVSPRGGRVHLDGGDGTITLTELDPAPVAPADYDRRALLGSPRQRLVAGGAWQCVADAHTLAVPDPDADPAAVIVSTLHLEPFGLRGDVQLRRGLDAFCRGLAGVQSLLDYQPIYVILPDIRSRFARHVRDELRGRAWIRRVEVPLRYPLDHFTLLARMLELPSDGAPVWAMRTEGVLAVDRVLGAGLPCTERIVSIAGPGAAEPTHVAAMVGYPIEQLLAGRVADGRVPVVNGGALTGTIVPDGRRGLDAECTALTLLPEPAGRKLLEWMRPGWRRRSYGRSFLGNLRPPFAQRMSTALSGELRACVGCGFCEQVCPAGIMPHVIHKFLYQDLLDEAASAGVERCVECGLCSYVCPSKIELRRQMVDAMTAIRRGDMEGANV